MCLRAHVFCKQPVIQGGKLDYSYESELLKIQEEYPNDPEQILLTWGQRRNRIETIRFREARCGKWVGQVITITRDSPDSEGSSFRLNL
jgi:hypothetical protein